MKIVRTQYIVKNSLHASVGGYRFVQICMQCLPLPFQSVRSAQNMFKIIVVDEEVIFKLSMTTSQQ